MVVVAVGAVSVRSDGGTTTTVPPRSPASRRQERETRQRPVGATVDDGQGGGCGPRRPGSRDRWGPGPARSAERAVADQRQPGDGPDPSLVTVTMPMPASRARAASGPGRPGWGGGEVGASPARAAAVSVGAAVSVAPRRGRPPRNGRVAARGSSPAGRAGGTTTNGWPAPVGTVTGPAALRTTTPRHPYPPGNSHPPAVPRLPARHAGSPAVAPGWPEARPRPVPARSGGGPGRPAQGEVAPRIRPSAAGHGGLVAPLVPAPLPGQRGTPGRGQRLDRGDHLWGEEVVQGPALGDLGPEVGAGHFEAGDLDRSHDQPGGGSAPGAGAVHHHQGGQRGTSSARSQVGSPAAASLPRMRNSSQPAPRPAGPPACRP